jgi:DNA-binding IclR family transcriptional regulator
VHTSAVTNASKLLLHFHNKGAGDYKELRKLTGLSNFGLAKYIRSLKKRGLIERDGWQKFKLTGHAVGLLEKAGCES